MWIVSLEFPGFKPVISLFADYFFLIPAIHDILVDYDEHYMKKFDQTCQNRNEVLDFLIKNKEFVLNVEQNYVLRISKINIDEINSTLKPSAKLDAEQHYTKLINSIAIFGPSAEQIPERKQVLISETEQVSLSETEQILETKKVTFEDEIPELENDGIQESDNNLDKDEDEIPQLEEDDKIVQLENSETQQLNEDEDEIPQLEEDDKIVQLENSETQQLNENDDEIPQLEEDDKIPQLEEEDEDQ